MLGGANAFHPLPLLFLWAMESDVDAILCRVVTVGGRGQVGEGNLPILWSQPLEGYWYGTGKAPHPVAVVSTTES